MNRKKCNKKGKIIMKEAKPNTICKCGKPADFAIKLTGPYRNKGHACINCLKEILESVCII